MSTSRLQVPMTDETRRQLQIYADAAGISLARASCQILAETAPVMVELAVALTEAKTAPAKAMRSINQTMERKLAELDQMKMDLSPMDTEKKAS